eukprot:jgi/Hompol1/3404/HPOL_006514-RA
MLLFALTALTALAASVQAQQNATTTGNCVTGRITFDPNRILNLYGATTTDNRLAVDVTKYDLTLDFGTAE